MLWDSKSNALGPQEQCFRGYRAMFKTLQSYVLEVTELCSIGVESYAPYDTEQCSVRYRTVLRIKLPTKIATMETPLSL